MTDEFFLKYLNDKEKYNLRILFIYTSGFLCNDPVIPHGIAILSSICKIKGIYAKCIDYSVKKYCSNILKNTIITRKINVVCISSITLGINHAYDIARDIKEINNNIMVLMGGPHVTVRYDEALKQNIDIIVRNEGELTFLELLPILEDSFTDNFYEKLSLIKGIVYKDSDGKVRLNPPNDRIINLDSVPWPDRDSFQFPDKYHNAIRIKSGNSFEVLGSRGCSEHCVFCANAVFGNKITFRSPKNIIDEICFIKNNYKNITQFEFLDDYLLFDLQRFNEICSLLIKRQVNLYWAAGNTRVDNVSLKLFKQMKKSGCFKINFGIDGGTDEILKSINKRITIEQAKQAINLAKQAGLFVGAYFIIGNHKETINDIKETIKVAKTLNADAVQFTINTPWPGTPLYRYLQKRNYLLSKEWQDFRIYEKAVFFTEHLNPEIIEKMYRKAYMEYYLTPRLWLKYLKNILTFKYIYLYITGFVQIFLRFFNIKYYFTKRKM